MTKLIVAIYRRMLLATILVIVAAVLCGVIYLNGNLATNSSGVCGNPDVQATLPDANVKGRELFYVNCGACHHLVRNMAGPSLIDAIDRIPKNLFYELIQTPSAAFKKSTYLQGVKEAYGNIDHPAFPQLSRKDIDDILEYLQQCKTKDF